MVYSLREENIIGHFLAPRSEEKLNMHSRYLFLKGEKKKERKKIKDNSTFTVVVCIILSLAIIKYKSLLEE